MKNNCKHNNTTVLNFDNFHDSFQIVFCMNCNQVTVSTTYKEITTLEELSKKIKEIKIKRRNKMENNKKATGFTLIEVLVVIAIIGVLAALVIPNFLGFMKSGTISAANTELGMIQTGTNAYMADYQLANLPNMRVGNISGYLTGTVKGTYNVTIDGTVSAVSYPGLTESNLVNGKWVK